MTASVLRASTLALLATVACGRATQTTAAPAAEPSGAAAPASSAPAEGSAPAAGASAAAATGTRPIPPGTALSGKVLETMDAGGYTYMRLDTEYGETWAAVNQSPVAVGDSVVVAGAQSMDGFTSSSLKRSFDRIVFGSLATGAAPAAAAAPGSGANPHAGLPDMTAAHGGVSSGQAPKPVGKVEKASGADGRTVAEVWAQRTALAGKSVTVRGQVVKVSSGILGKNWVHLKDGSGDAAKKSDDLTFTTTETFTVGDVVVMKGTVAVDKDFGAGYVYPVIVEGAKGTK